jgi:hypothetical protein
LDENDGNQLITTNDSGKRLKSKSINLRDFGVRIKVVVAQVQNKPQIKLQVLFPNEYQINDDNINYLRSIYGSSICISRLEEKEMAVLSVDVSTAMKYFTTSFGCAMSLSQIRVQAAGAPLLTALDRVCGRTKSNVSDENFLCKLGSHGKCGSYHCLSTKEK